MKIEIQTEQATIPELKSAIAVLYTLLQVTEKMWADDVAKRAPADQRLDTKVAEAAKVIGVEQPRCSV